MKSIKKGTDSISATKIIKMKKVLIRKPSAPSDEFALKGQAKDASCSFSPYL